MKKEIIGELLGTIILVFIGCGIVGVSIVYIKLTLVQIALTWGAGVAISIYTVKSFSKAHLNPAVSLAFFARKEINVKQLLGFIGAQFLGAMLAGWLLYQLFEDGLYQYEAQNDIARNSQQATATAKMFGEYFFGTSHFTACLLEAIGTFLLMIVIAIAQFKTFKKFQLSPIVIGLGLALLIYFIAPYTQAGFNPARDFGPRIIAYKNGWENFAFPQPFIGFFTVYIFSPIVGAIVGGLFSKRFIDRFSHSTS